MYPLEDHIVDHAILGITSGGGGGSVATDALWDAKGDLAVGTGADTAARLPKGTDGYFLKADSAETTGLKWVVLAGGGDALISNGFTQFAPQTSAQLASTLSDETGTGLAVFNTAPTMSSPNLSDGILNSNVADAPSAISLRYKPTTALTSGTDRDWHSLQNSSGGVLQVIKADGSIEFGGRSTTGGFITVAGTRTTESTGIYFIPTINTAGTTVPKAGWTAGIMGALFGPSDDAAGSNDTLIGGVFGPTVVAGRTHARVVGGVFALPIPGAATATYGDFWGWYVAGPGTHIGATVRTINNLAAGYVPSLHTSTTSKPLVVNNYGLAYVEEQKNATTINTGMFFANATAGYKAIMVRATSTGIGSDADGQLDLFGTTIKANGNVEFAQNQALQFRLENRTSDPGSPVAGQMWLRTDL